MGQYKVSEGHKAQEKVRKKCQGQAKIRKSTKQGVVGRLREPPHCLVSNREGLGTSL